MRWSKATSAALAAFLAGCDHPATSAGACTLEARPRSRAVGFDANGDGVLDVADGAWLMAYNFRNGAPVACLPAVEAFGDKVTDAGNAYAAWYALVSGTAVPVLADGACAELEDLPAACGDGLAYSVRGDASVVGTGTARFTADILLTSPALPVEAWQVSVATEGCTVEDATLAGTLGADQRDGGKRDAGVGMAQVSTAGGAVSLVVLDAVGGTSVTPAGDAILSLTLTAPVADACGRCAITLVDGQAGKGRPLTNVVSSGGRAYVPTVTGAEVEICPE